MDTPDLIFTDGSIITVDPETEGATAVAVLDGRIHAVGGRELLRMRGPGTDVIELSGRCLMPGFVEAHIHPARDQLMFSESVIDIRPMVCGSADAVRTAVHAAVAAGGTRPLLCYGLDPVLHSGFPEPTREWLDELAPGRPLVMWQNSGRVAWANTAALALAGLSADAADLPDGHFDRDRFGRPTGKAYGTPAILALVGRIVGEQLDSGLLAKEHQHLAARGVTLCGDMGFADEMRVLTAGLYRRGLAKVRTRFYEISSPGLETICPLDNGDDLFRQIGIKIRVDGGATAATAERLRAMVRAYHPHGWQIACRADDHTATEVVLDAYDSVLREYPRDDHRLRLEHCGAMTPEQYRRAGRLGVTCSLFMDHLYYWGDTEPECETQCVRARSALEADVRISFHNDSPVTPEEPLRNMACAITRTARSGRVLAAEEAINLDQAIRAQTIDAAYQLFADDITGSITPGKYADLVVLESDPHSVAPEELADIAVHSTYLAGRLTYRR
ncbi:amidohydrolase [Nocardia sp. NPDC050406]|uniref:amidohydrolase n=1 Tax=Nocardia sp. NPDC050406 TaxID=3364318 RepID=UPI0037969E26